MDQMQSYFVSLEKSFSVGLLFSVIAMGGGPVTALGISLESIRAISSLQLGFIIIGTLMAPKIIFLISSLMEYISGK
ncbi:MAG: hypothetical protein U9Q15_02240 [Patescibacteria group bacterium]|nr:hypothetical protein [Patescibacteria group bacterium]